VPAGAARVDIGIHKDNQAHNLIAPQDSLGGEGKPHRKNEDCRGVTYPEKMLFVIPQKSEPADNSD
jgi:hypothetical protein